MSGITNARHEDFTAVLNLPASPATVSALFTSAAGVSRWWGPTEGDATGMVATTSLFDAAAGGSGIGDRSGMTSTRAIAGVAMMPSSTQTTGNTATPSSARQDASHLV